MPPAVQNQKRAIGDKQAIFQRAALPPRGGGSEVPSRGVLQTLGPFLHPCAPGAKETTPGPGLLPGRRGQGGTNTNHTTTQRRNRFPTDGLGCRGSAHYALGKNRPPAPQWSACRGLCPSRCGCSTTRALRSQAAGSIPARVHHPNELAGSSEVEETCCHQCSVSVLRPISMKIWPCKPNF